jgi:hypothetical protein
MQVYLEVRTQSLLARVSQKVTILTSGINVIRQKEGGLFYAGLSESYFSSSLLTSISISLLISSDSAAIMKAEGKKQ